MGVTIVIPTFNEAPNITELVRRIVLSLDGRSAEIIFVDDSNDATPEMITATAMRSPVPVRLIHRSEPIGGLSGAVLEGFAASTSEWCVVMDGDLQHPPELIPLLLASGVEQNADVVVASRHVDGGSAVGLETRLRRVISSGATILTRSMFPVKLRHVTDPMTGFFAIRRAAVTTELLHPHGFKILLEILTRTTVTVIEEPFVFGTRIAGTSKATLRQGAHLLAQLAALRFGRLSAFAAVGALGAAANLTIMAGLQLAGIWYLAAATMAAVITIMGNFFLLERLVFRDLRSGGHNMRMRFGQSVAFNGIETAARSALLWGIVEQTPIPSLFAQAGLIAAGFIIRFVYHSRIVYKPRATTAPHPLITQPLVNGPLSVAKT